MSFPSSFCSNSTIREIFPDWVASLTTSTELTQSSPSSDHILPHKGVPNSTLLNSSIYAVFQRPGPGSRINTRQKRSKKTAKSTLALARVWFSQVTFRKTFSQPVPQVSGSLLCILCIHTRDSNYCALPYFTPPSFRHIILNAQNH